MLSEQQIQVLLEFYAFLCLNAGIEQNLEQQYLFLVLRHFSHLDKPLIESIDKPRESI